MVACYRISREQWTPEQAQAEMDAFGFCRRRFAHLTRFVREFPTLLLRDPGLRSTIRVDHGLVEIRDRMRWTCPTVHRIGGSL
jgi:hypothetical protein